jgi:hypothetical protein
MGRLSLFISALARATKQIIPFAIHPHVLALAADNSELSLSFASSLALAGIFAVAASPA